MPTEEEILAEVQALAEAVSADTAVTASNLNRTRTDVALSKANKDAATLSAGAASAKAAEATAAKAAAEAARDEAVQILDGVVWRGAWAVDDTYSANDAVDLDGSSYRALQPSTGVSPDADSAATYWRTISVGGADSTVQNVVPFGGSELAAPRRIKNKISDRYSIRDFGNDACGLAETLSSADEAGSFRKACESGERIYVPPGRYPLRSIDPDSPGGTGRTAVYETSGAPIDIVFAKNSLIIPGAEIDHSGQAFYFNAGTLDVDDVHSMVSVHGMSVDTSNLTAQITGMGILSVGHYNRVEIIRPAFGSTPAAPSGSNMGFGGGDTGVGTYNCNHVTIDSPWLVGFYDAAIYISGDAGVNRGLTDNVGEGLELKGGFFWRNGIGLVCKRDHMVTQVIGGIYRENGQAILGQQTNDGPYDYGRGWQIIGPRIYKTQRRPITLVSGHGHIISGAHICDYGLWISDQSELDDDTTGGINLWGASSSVVSGSYIGFREWALPGGAATTDGPHGVVLGGSDDPTESAVKNLITGCIFEKVYFSIREATGSDYNKGANNIEIDVVAGAQKRGENSFFDTVPDTELGGFVPVLAGSEGDATDYDLRNGRYWKYGKLIVFEIYIDLASLAGLNGSVSIAGLPAVAASSPPSVACTVSSVAEITNTSGYTQFSAHVVGGTSTILLTEMGSASALRGLTHAQFASSSRIAVSGSYVAELL